MSIFPNGQKARLSLSLHQHTKSGSEDGNRDAWDEAENMGGKIEPSTVHKEVRFQVFIPLHSISFWTTFHAN